MKSQLKDVSEFYAEIKRQNESKKDLIVPATSMRMVEDSFLSIEGEPNREINTLAHGQIAEKLGIPKRYYDEIGEIEGLRSINVNALMKHRNQPAFVRTLDNRVRAYLSDRYKPIDNFPLVTEAILPVTGEFNGLKILSMNITEVKMYLQFVLPVLAADVKPGDTVYYGVTISNSEVGMGALNIEEFLYRLVCSNGSIGASLIRKYHSGRRINVQDGDYNIYADDTIRADAEAYKLQIRDILRASLTETNLHRAIEPWKLAAGIPIEKPIETVKNVTKMFTGALLESETERLLTKLSMSGDMTKFGLANAVTNLAQEAPTDRAYEMEKVGQRIIELSPADWKLLAA